MGKKDEYYIGWRDEVPRENVRALKRFLIPVFVVVPLLAIAFVLAQKGFNNHAFEFGHVKTFTGRYYAKPFPMLVADKDQVADSLSRDILLVGYGKFGAEGIMQALEEQHGSLDGKNIMLSGSLIYGDGRTLMELSDREDTKVRIMNDKTRPAPEMSSGPDTTMRGEILDPKCYFGVMKPAEGKIHKSCAIRCISGGIPPVFRHAADSLKTRYTYYLLLGRDGEPVNKEILGFVGEEIEISGTTAKWMSWNILYIDPRPIQRM